MEVGEKIKTKKVHPCGNDEWEILRVGADFKLKCTKCGHIIMIDSEKFKKMRK